MTKTIRTTVLWCGPSPAAEVAKEFGHRGLGVQPIDAPPAVAAWAQACGIVYRFSPSTLGKTRQLFLTTCETAVNHGLCVYLLADDDTSQSHISTFVQNRPEFRRRTSPTAPHEIPEAIARHDAGPNCNSSLRIDLEMGGPLCDEEAVLLQRAFTDCSGLFLRPLTGGLSAKVFVGYAAFRDSLVGKRPLPFFVKIDKHEKVERERSNYQQYASHFIPFNLRPNLDFGRCIRGFNKGVLVGDFVDRSESLWDVARRNQAQGPIHSLFEDTLRGWRMQPFCEPARLTEGSVAAALGAARAFDYSRTKDSHVRAAQAMGTTASPIELWETLIGLRGQQFREAPMHGDLHGNNVRVRNSDAIVIDLASIANGPLVGDLAALETWLCFEVPPAEEIGVPDEANAKWKSLVDRLYAPAAFQTVPPPATEPSELEWLWTCVRQIRTLVGSVAACDTEYESSVAVYLLRRTMWEPDGDVDGFRRAYAYVLSSRLVADLAEKHRACASIV